MEWAKHKTVDYVKGVSKSLALSVVESPYTKAILGVAIVGSLYLVYKEKGRVKIWWRGRKLSKKVKMTALMNGRAKKFPLPVPFLEDMRPIKNTIRSRLLTAPIGLEPHFDILTGPVGCGKSTLVKSVLNEFIDEYGYRIGPNNKKVFFLYMDFEDVGANVDGIVMQALAFQKYAQEVLEDRINHRHWHLVVVLDSADKLILANNNVDMINVVSQLHHLSTECSMLMCVSDERALAKLTDVPGVQKRFTRWYLNFVDNPLQLAPFAEAFFDKHGIKLHTRDISEVVDALGGDFDEYYRFVSRCQPTSTPMAVLESMLKDKEQQLACALHAGLSAVTPSQLESRIALWEIIECVLFGKPLTAKGMSLAPTFVSIGLLYPSSEDKYEFTSPMLKKVARKLYDDSAMKSMTEQSYKQLESFAANMNNILRMDSLAGFNVSQAAP